MQRSYTVTRALICCTSLLLFVSSCAESPSPTSPATHHVNQGDEIIIGGKVAGREKSCTAGYVDVRAGRIFTAGHCGKDGEIARDRFGDAIGKIRRVPDLDVAHIEVSGTLEGVNGFSGDTHDDSVGMVDKRVCMRGSVSEVLKCGVVIQDNVSQLRITGSLAGVHGDSGAPVWSKRGFVGIYTGVVESEGGKTVFSTVERVDVDSL